MSIPLYLLQSILYVQEKLKYLVSVLETEIHGGNKHSTTYFVHTRGICNFNKPKEKVPNIQVKKKNPNS